MVPSLPPPGSTTVPPRPKLPRQRAHVHDLPDEMLSAIFQLFATDAQLLLFDSTLPLMAVCRRWNAVALATPSLWSSILFSALDLWPERKIAAYLERSKASKLLVSVFGSAENCGSACKRLEAHLRRIGHLEISTFQASMEPIWNHVSQMAHLESLTLANRAELTFKPAPVKDLRIELPKLRYICLEAIDMPWRVCHFVNLEELRILHFFLQPVVAVEGFLIALDRCVNLRKLSIVLKLPYAGVGTSDSKWFMHPLKNHLVSLPELRTLELSGYLDMQIQTLAMSLHAPLLDKAVLIGMNDPSLQEDWSHFEPWFPKLKSLTLDGWNDIGTLFQRVVAASPLFHYLDITLPQPLELLEPLPVPESKADSSTIPTVESVFTNTLLPSLHALRTRNIPPAALRSMIESQPTITVLQIFIQDIGLTEERGTPEQFAALEEDMAWLRTNTRVSVFGRLGGLEIFHSWDDKIHDRPITDAESDTDGSLSDVGSVAASTLEEG